MVDVWGGSWGVSWNSYWRQLEEAEEPTVPAPAAGVGGGGYHRRPTRTRRYREEIEEELAALLREAQEVVEEAVEGEQGEVIPATAIADVRTAWGAARDAARSRQAELAAAVETLQRELAMHEASIRLVARMLAERKAEIARIKAEEDEDEDDVETLLMAA